MTTQTAEVAETTEAPTPTKPARRTQAKSRTGYPELTGLEAAKADAKARDAAVLNGVGRKTDGSEPASPPKRRTRKAPAAAAAEPAKPARRTRTQKATSKASEPKPAPADKPDKQISKRKLARELVEVVAAHFAEFSEADRRQVSKWIEKVPVGGPNGEHEDWGPDRWWAPQLPRPTYAPFQ